MESGADIIGLAVKPLGEILKNLLPFVRFPTMTLEQLATVVRPLKLLPDSDLLDIFAYLASTGEKRQVDNKNCILKYKLPEHLHLLFTF